VEWALASVARITIGDLEQYVRVALLVEGAIAREVAPAQLTPDIFDRDRQSTGEEVFAVSTNRYGSPQIQGMRVTPLGRPRHDDHVRRKSTPLAA